MKKLIFAAFAAGAMVLAGCTKIEVKEVPDSRAIGFDNFVSNSVKAIDETKDLTKFYVYGGYADHYDLFNGDEVSFADSKWGYTDTRYWLDDTTPYNFAAYSDDNNATTATVALNAANTHLDITGYSVINSDNYGERDLVYAYATNTTYNSNSGAVALTFRHILSKLVFKFTAEESLQDIKLTFSNIKLNNVYTTADFKGAETSGNQIASSTWNNWSANTTSIEGFKSISNANLEITGATAQNSFATDPKFMIPQTVPAQDNKFTLSFSVTLSGDNLDDYGLNTDPYDFTIELPVPTGKTAWEPGFSYVYAASLSVLNFNDQLKPITFTATVGGWEPDINTDADDITLNE